MSANRDSNAASELSAKELDDQVASLRTVGGVYDYIAACVEYDNRPQTYAEPSDPGISAQHSQHNAALAAERKTR